MAAAGPLRTVDCMTTIDARPSLDEQRARIAVAALFLTNGALLANLLPRYPEIKSGLGLNPAAYGIAVASFPTGAMLAGLGAAALIRRFGSARVAVFGTILTSIGVLAAGVAPSTVTFMVALFCAGAADAVTDVGQNAHGLRVQRRYRRSIINSFHAVWSIGAVLGGGMAAGAIALDLPLGLHLGISAAVFTVVTLIAYRFCLPGLDEHDDREEPAPVTGGRPKGLTVRTVAVLVALVLIAMAGTIVEDAGNSWAALYLSADLGAPSSLAATGYIGLVGAQFVGRMIGDRMVDRFGQRTVARVGAAIAGSGMGLALAFPTVPGTVLGFAAAGFGVATLVPAAMHEADELPGLRRGTGLTFVSWLMRIGFLISPPLVGLVTAATSLRVGLLSVPLVCAVVVVLAQVLPGRGRVGRSRTDSTT